MYDVCYNDKITRDLRQRKVTLKDGHEAHTQHKDTHKFSTFAIVSLAPHGW